jgi:hypothetical protein
MTKSRDWRYARFWPPQANGFARALPIKILMGFEKSITTCANTSCEIGEKGREEQATTGRSVRKDHVRLVDIIFGRGRRVGEGGGWGDCPLCPRI